MEKMLSIILLACFAAAAQTIAISGTVTSGGQPLQGVIVSLISARIADTTDANGKYLLSSSVATQIPIAGKPGIDAIHFGNNRFEFDFARPGLVNASLYNLRGALIATVLRGAIKPGTTRVPFNLGRFGRSVYLLRVSHESEITVYSIIPGTKSATFAISRPAPAATGPLGKTAAAEWLQAVKLGYSSHLEQLAISAGTINIAMTPISGAPDFGPNVVTFDPSLNTDAMQNLLDSIDEPQLGAQFGNNRYAFLFKPGSYSVDVNVGFYTQVLGLGLSPDSVRIAGQVHSEADWMNGNATCTFWKSAEGLCVTPPCVPPLCVTPPGGTNRWAASQAAPNRRMHIKGNVMLDDGGWSSGGFFADCKVDGSVNSGSQQQYFSRNDDYGAWNGGGWNMVFVGVPGVGVSDSSALISKTFVPKTPLIAEKPFLAIDEKGNYFVLVPNLRRDSTSGVSWANGSTPGARIPIDLFYIAKPAESAATINAALSQGKNLLFTPGHYTLENTIRVTRPGTIVLGLGFPTLAPTRGAVAMKVADVDGVKVGGILFEGTMQNAPVLLEVGDSGTTASHAQDPICLYDIFCRVGGQYNGLATCFVTINSNDVILDHAWLWRADHGAGAGWNSNKNANGLVVNGNNVTVYGLFVEHTQAYQTLWNGNGGRTYFYQSEMPYDPPDNQSWSAGGTTLGYPSYKVSDGVKTHEAWGLGVYSVFRNNVTATNAFEVPANVPGVKMRHLVTKKLGGGTISHIINGLGGTASSEMFSYP
jgi:hypothetical protein